MQIILLTLHVLIALALVIVVLLQRSEGGALGIGGGTAGGLFTARGTANLLTRATSILAAAFMINSLILAIISGRVTSSESIFDKPSISSTIPVEPGDTNIPSAPLSQ